MTPRALAAARCRRRDAAGDAVDASWASTGKVCSTAARAACSSGRRCAPFLQRQRWFGAKSRQIRQARFCDWTPIRNGAHPAFLAIVAVEYSDGSNEAYFVPLAMLAGEPADRALTEAPAAVLARITGARKGAIVDGLHDDDTCERLLGDGRMAPASSRRRAAASVDC